MTNPGITTIPDSELTEELLWRSRELMSCGEPLHSALYLDAAVACRSGGAEALLRSLLIRSMRGSCGDGPDAKDVYDYIMGLAAKRNGTRA
jgi:hypothetical protein